MIRLLALMLAFVPVAAQATWLRAESPAFVAYSRTNDKDLRAKLRNLQDFDALLRLVTGLQPTQSTARLPVYFVSGRDFRGLGMTSSNVDGFHTSSPGLIAAFVATDRARTGFSSPNTVLFHEYTHHFMFHATRAAYPAWYIEGFAEYLSTAKFASGSVEYGNFDEGRVYGLMTVAWLPMRKVMTARVSDLKGNDDIGQFYAQSWLTVHYLSRDPVRRKQLTAYLAALGRGVAADTAFPAAFGMDYDAMAGRLRSYLRGSQFTRSRLTGAVGASTVDVVTAIAPLPVSADALLLPAARLAMLPFTTPANLDAEDTAERPVLLATVRTAAARYPGDFYAETVRAEAEIKLGDRAAGTTALDALLERLPKDPQALYLRGMTLIADGEALMRKGGDAAVPLRRARVLLARANAARPDDYRILAAHARSFGTLKLPDQEVDVLLRASELAPEVSEVATRAALVVAQRGDKARATVLLTPIANNPHGGDEAVAAAKLIEAIGRGEAATITVDETG